MPVVTQGPNDLRGLLCLPKTNPSQCVTQPQPANLLASVGDHPGKSDTSGVFRKQRCIATQVDTGAVRSPAGTAKRLAQYRERAPNG